MEILDRVRRVFSPDRGGSPDYLRRFSVKPGASIRPVGALLPGFQSTTPQYAIPSRNTAIRQGFRRNAVMRRCIDLLAAGVSKPTLQVLKADSRQPLKNHELTALFYGQPHTSGGALLRLLVQDLYTAGNAYWEEVRSKSGRVVAYWRLDPGRVAIEPDPYRIVGRYLYQVGGVWHPIPVESVVHWKFEDPDQPWFGLPPIFSAFRDLAVDNDLVDFSKVTMQNLAVPPLVIETEESLSPTEEDEQRQKWREKQGGFRRGDVAFVSGATKIHAVGLDMQKLAIGELIATSEARVAMVHGVPMILLGRSGTQADPTRANYHEAKEQFWLDTIEPLLDRIGEEIELRLLPKFTGSESLIMGWDTSQVAILQEAKLRRADKAATLFSSGLISRRHAQRLGGLEEQGPDVFYRPTDVSAVIQASDTIEVFEPPPEL